MLLPSPLRAASAVLALASLVRAQLGSSCNGTPLGAGSAPANEPYWLERIKHQGTSAFNPDTGYRVFRNVKDFGAVGDGVHDDTAAINAAIQSGGRCGGGPCRSSTVTPAVVYFPTGTYLVTAPIVPYYYTQLVGDAKRLPTILGAPNFDGMALIDANPYIPGGDGAQFWQNQNNFHRAIRNFIIDTRRIPAERPQGTGIHWQVAQATSLANIVFYMSTAPNTAHQGIWMENGSGGYMGDMVFNGGKFGIWGGNQQFTVRNITINDAQTCIYSSWNWGWTYQGVTFNNCRIGFEVASGGITLETQTTGSLAIIDGVINNVPVFIENSAASPGALRGSLTLNNVRLNNVRDAVKVRNGAVVLAGGSRTINSWAQGNVYRGSSGGRFVQGDIPGPVKASSLLDGSGRIVSKPRPQYAGYALNQIVSAKDLGARGDGRTDDTAAIRSIFQRYAGCKVIFFDAGTYVITDTIHIPAGSRIIGEAWTVLSARGNNFKDVNNPRVAFRVGNPGDKGVTEITDMIFSTMGSTPGAIVVEWNVRQPDGVQAGAGMWDTHIRTGGVRGTELEADRCPKTGAGGFDRCYAAFLNLHLTRGSSAYIESAWVWLADHDLDLAGEQQISLYSGRGILSESQGPVWLVGTGSEHHVIVQYNLVGAADHYMGLIQTESPYYQPIPVSPTPFRLSATYKDPTPYPGNPSAWALAIKESRNIFIFGAGLYSFFNNYNLEPCGRGRNCQDQIATIDTASTGISIYGLSTVGATNQISINSQGVARQADNINGFQSTIAGWTQ